jgi:hypothetical protein
MMRSLDQIQHPTVIEANPIPSYHSNLNISWIGTLCYDTGFRPQYILIYWQNTIEVLKIGIAVTIAGCIGIFLPCN